MKKLIFIFSLLSSFYSFGQWKIENYDDGFDKTQSIHTDFYVHKETECSGPSFLALSGSSLFLVSDCSTGNKSKIWYIDVIFTVNGEEKKYLAIASGGWEYTTKLLRLNYLLKLDGFLRNEVLESFLNATSVKIKATLGGYDPIFFKMKLNPQNTENAWDANTGGKYLVEKKAKQEEFVRKKKEEEDRIKLENQNKDADKTTLIKINDLISKNSLEDAAKEYDKLNFEYDDIRSSIQKKLNDKYENEVVELNFYKVEDYIKSNKDKINSIYPGNYSVKFDSQGKPYNADFPKWPNKQFKEFGSFTVKMNSKADIKIVIKDSILVSTVYNKSNTKPLFVDKNENFYFKSKNGLPAAQFVINPAIDKNSVIILKYYKREKYANGILLGTEGFYFEKTVEINKKDY